MKTRNLLLAFALPTLFAACTAEEIVNQADNNVSLANRALLGDLSVKIENPVASRASWSEEDLAWGEWEEGDVFSAALTDAVTMGTASTTNLYSNYVWSKNAEGAWSTTSQMVEGLYSFYSYKGIATKNDRKLIAFDITNQKADLDEPTKVLDEYQLFFSPLYKIEAVNTTAENNIDLPLKFYPYYSIAMFYIKNSTGQDLDISQIIMNGDFKAKGQIIPSKIQGEDFVYSVRSKDGVYETEYKIAVEETNSDGTVKSEYSEKEIAAMWEASVLDDAEDANQIVLNCDNWTLKDGKEIKVYMNVPAGAQTDLTVQINVVDEKGNAKTIYVDDEGDEVEGEDDIYAIESTNISKTSFKRGTPVAVFGYNNKAPKAVEIEAENLADAKGVYIDNEKELLELIGTGRGTIKVYNAAELILNSTIADALAENTACQLHFANPITIQDFENTVNLSKIVFSGEVTIKDEYKADGVTATEEGTVVVFGENVVFYDDDEDIDAELVIEKYSTVTMAEGVYNKVTNKGTLTIYALDADVEEIDNTGTLTVDNGSMPEEETEAASRATATPNVPEITTEGEVSIVGMNPTVNFNGGKLSYTADVVNGENEALDVDGIVAATGKNLELNIGADVTLKKAFTYAQAYTAKTATEAAKYITVNVAEEAAWLVDTPSHVGKLTNNGDVYSTKGQLNGHLVILSTSTNGGNLEVNALDVVKGAELENNGTIMSERRAANNGTIKNNSGAYLKLTHALALVETDNTYTVAVTESEGRVENYGALEFETTNGDGDVKASQEIYCVLENKSIADVEALNVERFHYNTIQLKGTFTADRDFGSSLETTEERKALQTKMANIKNIELNGATFDMNSATGDINLAFVELRVKGNVTLKGFTSAASKLNVFTNLGAVPTIKLEKSASLTVQNMTVTPGVRTQEDDENYLMIVGPTLTEDDEVTNATNGNYWSAAAKVYNKGVIELTEAPTVVTTKMADTASKNIYWEGANWNKVDVKRD